MTLSTQNSVAGPDPENTLVMELEPGRVVIQMLPEVAPSHVARIKELTRQGFYDGLVFHRVMDGFMAQTGDPTGTGRGGSGQNIKAEFSSEPYLRGTIGMDGGLKYFINVFKGLLGERMLRRLRYQLYSRILRFPLPHFRKVSQGELIPMITAEVEPLGGFIGDAFTLPLYQGGLLVTALIFIMAQDWKLGLMALMFYPVQGYVIPKLQRTVNMLGKERVRHVRKLRTIA